MLLDEPRSWRRRALTLAVALLGANAGQAFLMAGRKVGALPLSQHPSPRDDGVNSNTVMWANTGGSKGPSLADSFPTSVEELVRRLYASEDPVWELMRFEAMVSREQDSAVSGLVQDKILAYDSLAHATRDYIGSKLQSSYVTFKQWSKLTAELFTDDPNLASLIREDLVAATVRDPTVPNLVSSFLFSKGFHAVATYRISNALYKRGRQSLARYVQNLCSQYFAADIHPACTIGRALYIACGTCVVIGETARIGDYCIIMQGVTLGGTGKERGDRHPKIGSAVLVAPKATVLGNIAIGDGVIVSAGSVVVKPVPPYTRCSGVPAKVVSVMRNHAAKLQEVAETNQPCITAYSTDGFVQ